MGDGKLTKRIVREVTEKIVVTKKRGNKIYLLKDEEAYIVATLEIDGAHGLPRDIQTFTGELQQVLHDVGDQHKGMPAYYFNMEIEMRKEQRDKNEEREQV